MKKILNKIKALFQQIGTWWLLTFGNKKLKVIEFDAFRVVFRRFTMEIKTKSGNVTLKTMCMKYPQSYLYYCSNHGSNKTVEWFCNIVYQFVSLITTEQGLADDVNKSFKKYYKRMEKKSQSVAKSISETDDRVNEEIMNANIAYAEMDKKERKTQMEIVREILNDNDK